MQLARIEAFVLEAAIARPVQNWFRTLTHRPALLVRVTDPDGAYGWGEVWCNYPPGAAQHRARLLREVVAPLVVGRRFESPQALYSHLETALRVPALQCGEPGSFAQVSAGIDIAVWDLAARRAGLPLWRWLGGVPEVSVYASGIGPDRPEAVAAAAVAGGFRAAKLKVGFGGEIDRRNVMAVREVLGSAGSLMLDANQRWASAGASEAIGALAECRPVWVEEPIPADEPLDVWKALSDAVSVPLAAGENLRDDAVFDDYIAARVVRYLQPDPGKWGGVTRGLALARRATAEGLVYCPHWLGGGIGLMAALHLLAASGGQGWGEVDINPNPLRETLLPAGHEVVDGVVRLSEAPGLGVDPTPAFLDEYRGRHDKGDEIS